jgi:hypothetical protein
MASKQSRHPEILPHVKIQVIPDAHRDEDKGIAFDLQSQGIMGFQGRAAVQALDRISLEPENGSDNQSQPVPVDGPENQMVFPDFIV